MLSYLDFENIVFSGGWVGGEEEKFKTFVLNWSCINLIGFTQNSSLVLIDLLNKHWSEMP